MSDSLDGIVFAPSGPRHDDPTFQERWRNLNTFIDAVEKLAFEMPAPNQYTPRFVQMCVEARVAFLRQ